MRAKLFWLIIFTSLPYLFLNPFYGLLVYCCFNIIRPEMLFWGGKLGAKVFFLLYLVSFLGSILKSFKVKKRSVINFEIYLFGWMCFALLLSTHLSQYTDPYAFRYLSELFKILLVCLLFIFVIDTPKKILRMQNVFLGTWALLGLWGIEQGLKGNTRLEGLGGMSFGDSNGVAALFVLFFPIALFKIFEPVNKYDRIFGLATSVVIAALIVFTQSRGGLLGMSVSVFWLLLLSKNKIRNFMLIAMIVMISIPFVSNEIIERYKTLANPVEQQDTSAASRLIFWGLAYRLFEDNPFLGVGFNSYPSAKLVYENSYHDMDPGLKANVFRKRAPFVTHSTYMQMISEGGLFAFIPFIWVITRQFWKNRKIRRVLSEDDDQKQLQVLLKSIECGIIGFCVCIVFINAILAVFLPIQIVTSGIIRNFIIGNFVVKN